MPSLSAAGPARMSGKPSLRGAPRLLAVVLGDAGGQAAPLPCARAPLCGKAERHRGCVRTTPGLRLSCRRPPKASQPEARRSHRRGAGGGWPDPLPPWRCPVAAAIGYWAAWAAAAGSASCSSSSSSCWRSSRCRNSIAPMSQGPIRRRPSWSVLRHTASLPALMA